ncbi:uncharacterized protein LOC123510932 [Portunus trituberculatus]|uniref:uncharacterized protein LOC123510932 n=1 Tax=Portunus trituberculatus TaxID=210409 RepID=UPI001E1CC4D5|nr:uncharacterized protein LOC123510932 [Portunus trituberculatus]
MKNILLGLVMVVAVSLAAASTYRRCPAEVNVRCPPVGNTSVHLPHPHYCNMYCQCVGEGLAYALYCPWTLLWDDTIQACNWPDNVDCGNRPVQHL